MKKTVTSRNYRDINLENFKQDIMACNFVTTALQHIPHPGARQACSPCDEASDRPKSVSLVHGGVQTAQNIQALSGEEVPEAQVNCKS